MTNTINSPQNDTWQFPVGYEQIEIPATAETSAELPPAAPQETSVTNEGHGRDMSAELARGVIAEAEEVVAAAYRASPEGLAAEAAATAAARAEKTQFEQAALARAAAYTDRIGLMQQGALLNEGVKEPLPNRDRYGLAA